jgi:hypothetical protein
MHTYYYSRPYNEDRGTTITTSSTAKLEAIRTTYVLHRPRYTYGIYTHITIISIRHFFPPGHSGAGVIGRRHNDDSVGPNNEPPRSETQG